jgi:hypothetical protein
MKEGIGGGERRPKDRVKRVTLQITLIPSKF